MKTFVFLVAMLSTASLQPAFAQNAPPLDVLTSYYALKNSLVNGDATSASANATALHKAFASEAEKNIPSKDKAELQKQCDLIAKAKDIKSQREYFSNLSNTMIIFAKSYKLAVEPIYVQYCPMKKSSWLSNEKTIRNPYYGSSMLTCGKVTETIQ